MIEEKAIVIVVDDTPYVELANAIVLQACNDYRRAYARELRRYGFTSKPDPEFAELERFFHSDWYKTLTSVDGEYLMQRIRYEVDARCKRPSIMRT